MKNKIHVKEQSRVGGSLEREFRNGNKKRSLYGQRDSPDVIRGDYPHKILSVPLYLFTDRRKWESPRIRTSDHLTHRSPVFHNRTRIRVTLY